MYTFKCLECKYGVEKKYVQKANYVSPDGGLGYWVFICQSCGQEYHELCKPVIKLEHETI